jgi:L-threonylcarbamoyladenylate synthase
MHTLPSDTIGLQKAVDVLRSGYTIAHATETCYGLACDATNKEAVERLFFIKKRNPHKLVSILVESIDQAKQYIEWNENIERLTTLYWPGAVSIIGVKKFEAKIFVSPIVDANAISIRCSSHPTAQALVRALGKPIVTSSANISDSPETYGIAQILEEFEDQLNLPALILDDGTLPPNKPSTIVDCTGSKLQIIRQGDVKIDIL